MKFLKLIFILFFLFSCKAQRNIIQGDFQFFFTPNSDKEDLCETVKIKIFKNGKYLQTINQKFGYNFLYQDINFDGKKDFRLRQCSWSANIPYFYWIYNVEKGFFERNRKFEEITSPRFDSIKKEIISFWKAGAGEYGKDVYKIENNIPIIKTRVVERNSYDSYGGYECLFTDKYDFEKKQMISTWDGEGSMGKSIYKILGEDNILEEEIIIYGTIDKNGKLVYVKEYSKNIKGKMKLVKEEYGLKRKI